MVIRKPMANDVDVAGSQNREEPFRVGNTGHAMHLVPLETFQRPVLAFVFKRNQISGNDFHWEFTVTAYPRRDDHVHALDTLQRFAQRARRHTAAVPEPSDAVHHTDLDISTQSHML